MGAMPTDAPPDAHQHDLEYDVVDVFGDRPFSGNQLAVVHGAGDLPDAALLAITREFGFSETTFPAAASAGRYEVRIFTPGGEIPFAGHPTLGTAWVLRERGVLADGEVVQACAAGEIPVRLDGDRAELSAAARDLSGPLPRRVAEALLADVGLVAADLAGEAWLAGAGLTFVHLPVAAGAVARAHPSLRPLRDYAADLPDCADPVDGVNLHTVETGDPLEVHARVFVPGLDVAEDPATGSAAAGLGMALVASGRLPEGGDYLIRQGIEMGRPSRLRCHVETRAGAAVRCRVAGLVHPVARGRVRVPDTGPGTGAVG
jgi:trans-2,3-dihydro-3-hydroxyanthranilate isomerase